MGWKVRITGLAPASRDKIPQISQVLAKLPGMTLERAQQGLKHPPLDMPPVKTDEDAQKLSSALTRLGLTNQIFMERSEVSEEQPTQTHSQATLPQSTIPQSAPPTNPAIKPPHHAATKQAQQDPFGLKESRRLFDAADLRPPIIPSAKPKAKTPVFSSILMISIFILLGWGLWFLQGTSTSASPENIDPEINPKESPNSASSKKQSSDQNSKQTPSSKKSAEVKAKEKDRHALAKRQQQYSDQLLKQAEQTADVRKSTELLQKALQYNPYNTKGWQALIEKHRRTGNQRALQEAEKGLQQSEKVRAVLASIATQFGTEAQVEIQSDQIRFQSKKSAADPQSFHQTGASIYDTVHEDHPEKTFDMEQSTGERLQVRVEPGEDYPEYQDWNANARTLKSAKNPERSDK